MGDSEAATRPNRGERNPPRPVRAWMRRSLAALLLTGLAALVFSLVADRRALDPDEINWITAGNNYFQNLGDTAGDAPIPDPASPWGNASPPIAKYAIGASLAVHGEARPELTEFWDFDRKAEDPEEIAQLVPESRLTAARRTSVVFGVLTCLAIALLVGSIWGLGTGLVAGLLTIASPVSLDAFTAVTDSAAWLCMLTVTSCAALWFHRCLRSRAPWRKTLTAALALGILSGLTAGIRLAGLLTPLLMLSPIALWMMRGDRRHLSRTAIASAAMLVTFLVLAIAPNPHLHSAPFQRLDEMLRSEAHLSQRQIQDQPDRALDSIPERVAALVPAILFQGDPFFGHLSLPLGALFLLVGLIILARRLVPGSNREEAIVPIALLVAAAAATLALVRLERAVNYFPVAMAALPISAAGMKLALLFALRLSNKDTAESSPKERPTLVPTARESALPVAPTRTLQEAYAEARIPRHFLDSPIKYLFLTGLIAIFILAAVNLHGSLSGTRRFDYNVVLITVDGLRADRLSCLGQERGLTPNIDELARRGMLYERTFAPSTSKDAGLASVLTGLSPFVHGVGHDDATQDPLGTELTTLPEVLKDKGYETHAIVARPGLQERSFDQGYEALDFEVVVPEEMANWETARAIDAAVTDRAIVWLREERRRFRIGGERFFLHLGFSTPSYLGEHPGDAIGEAVEGAPPSSYDDIDITAINQELLATIRDPEEWYAQAVRAVDFEVRRVLEVLDDCRLHENTLVILVSTAGEAMPSQDASILPLSSVRIPLVIACPNDFQLSHRASGLARPIDIAPTVLHYLGISDPVGFPGRSLRQEAPSNPLITITGPDEKTAFKVTDGRYSLWLPSWTAPKESRLYDLLLDPDEQHDVRPEKRTEADRLLQRLAQQLRIESELASRYRSNEDLVEIMIRLREDG
ncbi:MAG: sulfatase-like hydrolase/transferase [Planctomycetota bacterium]